MHINKCGGTSISRYLNTVWPLAGTDSQANHCRLEDTLQLDKRNAFYFKFAFVRNSWDRLVSIYHYRVLTNQTQLGKRPIPFKDWAKKICERDPFYYNSQLMFATQLHYLTDEKGDMLIDYIGRFESLQQDFDTVCDKISASQGPFLPRQERQGLPHINATKHQHYTDYYDDEIRQIVAETHKEDIEYFEYEFGE